MPLRQFIPVRPHSWVTSQTLQWNEGIFRMQHHPTAAPAGSVVPGCEWPDWAGTLGCTADTHFVLCLTFCFDFQGNSFFRIMIIFYLNFIAVIISEQRHFLTQTIPKGAVGGGGRAQLWLRTRSCVWVLVALSVFGELGRCFSLGPSMHLGSRGPVEHLGPILNLRNCSSTRAKLASAIFNLNIALAPHWD